MSFKVVKLTVGKGQTVGDEKAGKWTRVYYELEAEVEDEHQIELAKGSIEALLDGWLRGESITQAEKPKSSWDPSKIKWTEAEGSHGRYERSEDVNSLDFKELMKDLEQHNDKLSRDGFFFWKFEKSAIIGRKKRQK
jgi:hypothetical protein